MGRRLFSLVAILPLIASCACSDCGRPYTSGDVSVPFSITLSGVAPVGIRDLGLKNLALPSNASATATLNLRDVDPRLRVATIGTVDPSNQGAERIGRFLHPDYKNDMAADVARLPCYAKGCQDPVRVIFELTDPLPDDRLTVNGTVDVHYGFDGDDKLPEKIVQVTGLDDAIQGHAPDVTTASDAGPAITLDADHPIALAPITMSLDADESAEARTVISESVLHSIDGIAYLIEPEKPAFQYDGTVLQLLGNPTYSMDPYSACDLGRESSCGTSGVLRLTWVGPDRVDGTYSVDTVVAGYGQSGLPAGIQATTTYGDPVVVPEGAPRVSAAFDGTLQVDRGSPDGRGTAWFRLQVDHAPSAPQASIVEVPGIVVLTFSATGRDGHGAANGKPAQVRVSGPLQPLPPLMDVPLDGRTHVVGLPLFASCRPGDSCTIDFFFELYPPFEGEDALPVTMTFNLEARMTSFARDAFPGDTAISIGPRP